VERIEKDDIIDHVEYKDCTIKVVKGDITDQPVDAIVNPANGDLEHKGGAAKNIQDSAGYELVEECNEYMHKYGKLPTGGAIWTHAGELPCKYVFHTVGPK